MSPGPHIPLVISLSVCATQNKRLCVSVTRPMAKRGEDTAIRAHFLLSRNVCVCTEEEQRKFRGKQGERERRDKQRTAERVPFYVSTRAHKSKEANSETSPLLLPPSTHTLLKENCKGESNCVCTQSARSENATWGHLYTPVL